MGTKSFNVLQGQSTLTQSRVTLTHMKSLIKVTKASSETGHENVS